MNVLTYSFCIKECLCTFWKLQILCFYLLAFSKFYYRHSELIVKYNIGLKTLLQQGISEPIFYGDLVYKFKRIVGKPNFSDQFKKIVKRYIRVGYNLDIMRQSACLVLNPITVYSFVSSLIARRWVRPQTL